MCLFFVTVQAQTIQLHPKNPHYFLYKGKPEILITSAEHYGSVLNLDFDYKKYLETLQNQGMNYTRIFTGSYVEIPGSFGIENNTLAPAPGRFLLPWEQLKAPGIYSGEKKVDLSKWNSDYFDRLKDFVSLAEKLNIIVEVTFFCSTYQDAYWERNPFNPENNINEIPAGLDRKKSNTLENGNLTGFQKRLVEKLVTELNNFDNVFYEIQNEPWSDNPQKALRLLRTLDPQPGQGEWFKWSETASEASLEWQKVMAKTVVETEANLPKKHMIAQNYTNFKHSVPNVDTNVSIMNFHYAWPEAVWLNYGWNRAVNFDESGFAGSSDTTYLRQAWQFILAGGAIFNNLDYSFYVGTEDGTGTNNAPGGGSTILRNQLKILKNFMESFDFVQLKPDFTSIVFAPGVEFQCLSEPGKQYAAVFNGPAFSKIKIELPRGKYRYEFFSPFDGKVFKKGFFNQDKSGAKELELAAADFLALKIVRE